MKKAYVTAMKPMNMRMWSCFMHMDDCTPVSDMFSISKDELLCRMNKMRIMN